MADSTATVEDYIKEFVDKTNDGEVLTYDISTLDLRDEEFHQKLTKEETKEREDWKKTREELRKYYKQRYRTYRAFFPASCEEMLRLRVAPPVLGYPAVSPRSASSETRARRHYPAKITAWKDFEQQVKNFKPKNLFPGEFEYDDVLHYSLHDHAECNHELHEKSYIQIGVLQPLTNAGLLKYKDDPIGHPCMRPRGSPDMGLMSESGEDDNHRVIPIEFKSTHNLLVPADMETIVTRYHQAVQEINDYKTDQKKSNASEDQEAKVAEQNERAKEMDDKVERKTIEWSNIVDPLAQIIGYMRLSESRYGVFSSGTRTYFLYVNDKGIPSISNAWRVGKENYLRAWSYFFQVAHTAERWTDAESKPRVDDNSGNSGRLNNEDDDVAGHGSEKPQSNKKPKLDGTTGANSAGPAGEHGLSRTMFTTSPSSLIPLIECEEIQFLGWLGAGNHQVHLARWKGQSVAVKSFDMFKDYKWFEREVQAYEHLQKAWGELVLAPYFISDMYGAVALLGMQLGRDPNMDDENYYKERARLFSKLKRDYDFDHLDTDNGNAIYIRDGEGKERLVAMDLERHEIRGARR
jgi:hypothetical protein